MILSIITCGKNDEYAGNFLQRIQFNLSKLEDNIRELKTNQIEIIVVDWGSDKKLYDVLDTSKFQFTRFYHVPKEICTKYSPDSIFSYSKAMNAGYRRSFGDFVFFIDGDSYIPTQSFINLYNLIKNSDKLKTFYWASRYHIPLEIYQFTQDSLVLDDAISNWSLKKNSWRHEKISLNNFSGAAMGLLLSRNICEESTCWFEELNKWGWLDIELNARLSRRYTCLGDLEDINDSCFFHIDHHSIKWGGQSGGNQNIHANHFKANPDNWGLIEENLNLN